MKYPIHIGIVTYNSRDDIEMCLAAVFQQSYPDYQVTIVDNASSDDTVAWLQQRYPDIALMVNTENIGFGRAHNQIMATIGQAHYLALNPDAILAANYIEKLLDALENHHAGWLTGKLLLSDGQHLYSAGHALLSNGFAFNISYGMPDSPHFNIARKVFGASAAAVLYSADLMADLGQPFFDEALFLYGEDTDVDWRSQHRGWNCWYIPTATATHRGSIANSDFQAQAVTNRYLSIIKNACLVALFVRHMPIMVLHILLRLILTPQQGWAMLRRIIRHLPTQWQKRQAAHYDCTRLNTWHTWSKQQASHQPHTLSQRLQHFWMSRFESQNRQEN
ncbi:MAG: glycosyltransferase family 2 protein [Anaerolineae bacterium]|nr:glycosyltransferase family 2 protein [Anaerolineae bacterium]